MSSLVAAQVGGWDPEWAEESKKALNEMVEATPKLKSFIEKAYGYAAFPKVTYSGIGISGASGRGVVYKNYIQVDEASLKQASIGLQLGG